jgi:hypothetical protein
MDEVRVATPRIVTGVESAVIRRSMLPTIWSRTLVILEIPKSIGWTEDNCSRATSLKNSR